MSKRIVVRSLAVAGLAAAILALCTCPAAPPATSRRSTGVEPLIDPALQLLVTPSPAGHQPFVTAIASARSSIDMTMFHLTDPAIVDALIGAVQRGVRVRVIVDGKGVKAEGNRKAYDRLRSEGVLARGSSPGFSITHVKAMVVDGETAFITAINLTRDADRTRDLGIVTRDRGIVDGVEALFAADWRNIETLGHTTPVIDQPSLVVAPVNARTRLRLLIHSAQHELSVTVENLGDQGIEDALAAAVTSGVAVRLIVPLCDKNPNPLYNLPAAHKLAAIGVDVRMMPAPETTEQPYMHSKMILADRTTAYVGSVNFSVNSLTRARELGIVFAQPAAAAQIQAIFDADWARAIPPPADGAGLCH